MKTKRYIFILSTLLILFITNQVLERLGIWVPFLYSYLDDLLVVPITLGIYGLVPKPAKKQPVHSLLLTLVCVVGYSFHFELLMPALSTRYTADIWDIVAYACGGGFYSWVMLPTNFHPLELLKKHANKI